MGLICVVTQSPLVGITGWHEPVEEAVSDKTIYEYYTEFHETNLQTSGPDYLAQNKGNPKYNIFSENTQFSIRPPFCLLMYIAKTI